jgi:hypothetical protein
MESYDQADSGYPEEQPGEPDSSDVREKSRPDAESERAPDNDDGKATGNPAT